MSDARRDDLPALLLALDAGDRHTRIATVQAERDACCTEAERLRARILRAG